jgi:beta-1,4-N-acetylgalactosaminyltransferase 2
VFESPGRRRRVSQVVTVIMKTFQRPRTATLAVEQLRRYYPEIRLLVADDGRPPIAFADASVEVLRLPFDSGISRGRNAALARVETEFFALMDDDHFFSRRTKLGRMLELLERGSFDILGASVFRRRPTKRLFPKRRPSDFFVNLRLEAGTLHFLDIDRRNTRRPRACDAVENFFLARTRSVRSIGGWDDRLKVDEHVEFFLRAKRAGLKVGYTTRAGVDHVQDGRERRTPDYLPFRFQRVPEFRRIWFEQYGIRRVVDRDGESLSAQERIDRRKGP